MIVIVEAREVGPGRDKLVGIATYRRHIHTRTYIKIISPSPAVGVDPWIITGSFEDHNNAFLKRPFSRPSSTTSGFHVHQMQVPCGLSRGLSRTARNTGQKGKKQYAKPRNATPDWPVVSHHLPRADGGTLEQGSLLVGVTEQLSGSHVCAALSV